MTEHPEISAVVAPATFPIVMILGDGTRAEMRRLWEWLDQSIGPMSRRVVARDISTAVEQLTSDLFPDLIIVLQSWSDEFSRKEIHQLLAFAPLARIVVCYGAWCESDGRNHSLWPQSVRVPLWAAPARIEQEWQLVQNPGVVPAFPLSASREEVFAADHTSIDRFANTFSFLVDSPDPAYWQSVIEIMVQAGHEPDREQPDVILIDVDPWDESRAAALLALIDRHPAATPVALTNLWLSSMGNELSDLGVTRISHKLGFRPPIF